MNRPCAYMAVLAFILPVHPAAGGDWRIEAQELCEKGRQGAADSMYQAHYAPGRFDPALLLQWAEVKGVLEQYPQAAQLLCEGMKKERRLAVMMQSQMARLLLDADSSAAHAALDAYGACVLSQPGADTAGMGRWLAQMYGRFGLYDQERLALTGLAGGRSDVSRLLMDLSQGHLVGKRYRQAVEAARWLCRPGSPPDVSEFGATVMFQAYERLGMRDSAVTWLERARPSSQSTRHLAAVLYQQAGLPLRADSIIAVLPEGTPRDTLVIRQVLFSGKPDSALRVVSGMETRPWWRSDRRGILAWKARCALYAGDAGMFDRCIDSIDAPPSWPYAREVVRFRYHSRMIAGDEALLRQWGAMEYALFRGSYGGAAAALASGGTGAAQRALRMTLVKRLLDHGDVRLASEALGRVDTVEASGEEVYYCADILIRQGAPQQGKALLERMILRNPRDVFSSRARIFLEKLKL